MIMISAVVLGAFIGAFRAKKRQASRLDILQYTAVYAIAFFVVAMFITVAIGWIGWG